MSLSLSQNAIRLEPLKSATFKNNKLTPAPGRSGCNNVTLRRIGHSDPTAWSQSRISMPFVVVDIVFARAT
jgi:hypothetical protein